MSPSFSPSSLEARQQRLRALLGRRKLSLIIASKPANIFYLTGFRGSAGVAVFESSEAVLWVDPRYTLQARTSAFGVELIEARRFAETAE